MDELITEKTIPRVVNFEPVEPAKLIEMYEHALLRAELEVETLKKLINNLKQQQPEEAVNIKWRSEIRKCINNRIFGTSYQIAECIAANNGIKADRNIKLKVATTLSLMHNEGEIGRTLLKGDKEFRYGSKDYFYPGEDKKLTILTDEMLNTLEKRLGMDLVPKEDIIIID